MPFTDSITSLSNYDLACVRRAEAPRVDGREQPTIDTAFIAPKSSVQPPTNEDLNRLPEGRTIDDVFVVFTTTPLQIGGPGTGFKPDLVAIEGKLYEIEHLEHWKAFGTQYWYALVRRTE
jgi:hypothetical protein